MDSDKKWTYVVSWSDSCGRLKHNDVNAPPPRPRMPRPLGTGGGAVVVLVLLIGGGDHTEQGRGVIQPTDRVQVTS